MHICMRYFYHCVLHVLTYKCMCILMSIMYKASFGLLVILLVYAHFIYRRHALTLINPYRLYYCMFTVSGAYL